MKSERSMSTDFATCPDDGVDVTRQVGTAATDDERHYYDLLVGHFERSKKEPSIQNYRLCVEAYDNLIEEIRKR